jgi:hypothetical protein
MRSYLCVLALAMPSLAQSSGAGSTEFVFLRNFQGTRMAGMVGIPASGEELGSLTFQPASFARLTNTRAEISTRYQMPGITTGSASYADKVASGVLAGRIDFMDAGSIAGIESNGESTGKTHQPGEMMLDLAFAEPMGERLTWGVGIKAIEENLDIDNSRAWGLALDMGVTFQPGSRKLAYSGYMSNLGTKLTGHTRNEQDFGPLPLTFGFTTRFTPSQPRGAALFLDLQKPIDNDVLIRIGTEYKVSRWVEVRAGWRTDVPELTDGFRKWVLGRDLESTSDLVDLRWSLGGTVRSGDFGLSYAFQWWTLLDAVHSITLTWDIGRFARGPGESAEP